MRIDFNGQSFRVRFAYEFRANDSWVQGGRALEKASLSEQNDIPFDPKNPFNNKLRTICDISVKEGEEFRGIAGDYVIKHPSDPLSKIDGRKMSLTRALRHIDDRELRTAIWKQYLSQHKCKKITRPQYVKINNDQNQEA